MTNLYNTLGVQYKYVLTSELIQISIPIFKHWYTDIFYRYLAKYGKYQQVITHITLQDNEPSNISHFDIIHRSH